jgi:DNA-binding LacI/PurR family transcriptional regulator
MKISIYDVADLAGVSISTVSRVLNKSGYVSSKTEQKVLEAVKKLNFIPSSIAQNLANNNTKLIGLYFPYQLGSRDSSSSTYLIEFVKGVNEVLIKWGYHLLLINETATKEQIELNQCQPQYYSFIKQKRIDGLILGGTPILCSAFLELLNSKVPMVYIGEKTVEHTGLNVYAQYKQYNRDLLAYFYKMNHKHIAVFSEEEKIIKSVIQEFLIEQQDPSLKINYYQLPGNLDSYIDLLSKIFTHKDIPTALLVQDISVVQQTINYLNKTNLEVPNDVSLATIEHQLQDGEQCFPAVTSVYVPAFQMAVEATTLLFHYLEGKQPFNKEILVESNIVERNSVINID